MPTKKLSRAEIQTHLRRWFWVYLLGAAALLFLNHLAFTMTQPRTPEENILRVYLVGPAAEVPPGAEDALLEKVRAEVPAIAKIEFISLPFAGDGMSSADMLLPARLTLGDGDAFICSPAAYRTLLNLGACLPLEDILISGWMRDYTPVYAEDETGDTFAAAMLLPDGAFPAALDPGGKYLVVPAYSAGLEHSLANLTALDKLFAIE